MSVRKSSRGNPYHDEKGRFCSGPRGNAKYTVSEKTPEEYEQRTKERFGEKTDKPIRALSDLQEHGWVGGAYDFNGGSVWSKDGYTLVTARHGEPIKSAGHTKRVGDNVEFYDKSGNYIISVPTDVADQFKTTKADTFTLRTPNGETYQMKSLDDANKFVEADKEAHFGQMTKTFEKDGCKGIKQPVEISETSSGEVFVTANARYGDAYLSHKDTKNYYFAYDDEHDMYNVHIHSNVTDSTAHIPMGMTEKRNCNDMTWIMQPGKEKYEFNGEKFEFALIDRKTNCIACTLNCIQAESFSDGLYPEFTIHESTIRITDDGYYGENEQYLQAGGFFNDDKGFWIFDPEKSDDLIKYPISRIKDKITFVK